MSIYFYFENMPNMTLCCEHNSKNTKYVSGNIITYIIAF